MANARNTIDIEDPPPSFRSSVWNYFGFRVQYDPDGKRVVDKNTTGLSQKREREFSLSSAYPGPGHGGSILSKETQTVLSPATCTRSSRGILRCSQAS